MPRLFHISEEEDIQQFVPRVSKEQWGYEKYVWAISEEKLGNYIFPRACPRICISIKDKMAVSAWVNLEKLADKKCIIFVANEWKEDIVNCLLCKYEFDPTHFFEIDSIAGYYVSRAIEVPRLKFKIKDCLKELNALGVALIFTDRQSLEDIRDHVIQNISDFSIIKWSNFVNL